MAKQKNPMKISTLVFIWTGILFVIVGAILIVLVNYQTKKQALIEAEDKAHIILDRNLATHNYFTHQLKPKLFQLTDSVHSDSYFEPAWMSSGYAIREIEKYFHSLNPADFYYKQSAINALNPENEADAYEKSFIDELNKDPKISTRSGVRNLDGKPYFVLLRPGEAMQETCLRCHSTPDKAPLGLVKHYGSERGFHRKIGEIPSAISIRIPLSSAYAEANRFSIKFSALLLITLGCVFGVLLWIAKRFIFAPLTKIQEKAHKISMDSNHLGEEIPLPKGRELSQLTTAFNTMSVVLRNNSVYLEERATELSKANEQLSREITERKQAEKELEKHREHLEELVKERTSELKEKNTELERMNEVFTGREFRVKELRDRVKELEESKD